MMKIIIKERLIGNKVRIIAMLTALFSFLVVMYFAGGVKANADEVNSGDEILATYDYISVNNDTAYVVTCNNKSSCTAAVIPTDHDGKSVIGLADNAFEGCESLMRVTLTGSVITIGTQAFYNCILLRKVTLGNTQITEIKEGSFRNCLNLISIDIPDSVTSIGEYAFCECNRFRTVTIPDSVESIGSWAFMRCGNLVTVNMGNNVVSIGDYAFQDCYSLNDLVLPVSLRSVGRYAFYYCLDLSSLRIKASEVPEIGPNCFLECSPDLSIEIPATLLSAYTENETWSGNAEKLTTFDDTEVSESESEPTSEIVSQPNGGTTGGNDVNVFKLLIVLASFFVLIFILLIPIIRKSRKGINRYNN